MPRRFCCQLLVAFAFIALARFGLKAEKQDNESIRIAIIMPMVLSGSGCKLCSRNVLAVVQAIDVINNKTDGFFDDLLPNNRLEYEFYDTKGDPKHGAILAGRVMANAFGGKGADVIIGAGFSSVSIILATILNSFNKPMISPLSTSGSLGSDKFTNFMRTVPADDLLVLGMVRFAKYYVGWNVACIISGTDEYSINGGDSLVDAAKENGINILQREFFVNGAPDMTAATDRMVLTGSKLFF